MKKGQGLSLNTIIIAAIVLIVLIVLWAIFTGRMGKFTAGLKSEEEKAQAEAKKFESMATGEETPLDKLSTCFGRQSVGAECRCGNNRCVQPSTPGGCGSDNACPT